MLLTISTTHTPATDLGFLLHKHPGRCQTFTLSFGKAYVFYPHADAERCTAALLLDIDPVGLARRGKGSDLPLAAYVSDRPYVASSFLSVALARVYRSALAGVCNDRPELAVAAIPLEAMISVLPSPGGEALLRRLFEPLGYTAQVEARLLDEQFPEWGESPYYTVTLSRRCRLADLLGHLYVLVPVLDRDKHYYVGNDEVEKLLRHGAGWLAEHPERDFIISRYLRRNQRLTRAALDRLLEDTPEDCNESPEADAEPEMVAAAPRSLAEQRLEAVAAVLKEAGARRVLDLGCGEGRLLQLLLADRSFDEIAGMDVSHRELERARERLNLDRLPPKQRERIVLLQGSLVYRDARLAAYDAAAVIEVIEHLDPPRLAAFERSLFEFARPETVVITTPNADYNALYPDLEAGQHRHRDHRFEWTRAEFRAWAAAAAARAGYTVRLLPIGAEDPEHGAPTQMGVFSR